MFYSPFNQLISLLAQEYFIEFYILSTKCINVTLYGLCIMINLRNKNQRDADIYWNKFKNKVRLVGSYCTNVLMCFFYGSQNKRQLFPYTELSDLIL